MNIFGLFSLFGGLAMFLYGMNVMGSGLEKLGGGKFEQILEKLTSNPIKGVVLGAAVTAVIQSSSATTVMVVGFVNSGIMKLGQAIGTLGKTESFLMVGFEDDYSLYMGGNKLEKGAFVSVRVFGKINSSQSNEMTAKICQIFADELDIPGQNVYVTYQGIADWGWNGNNF